MHYHFEREIEEVLQDIHKNYVENGEITLEDDLRFLSLLFRLLRQQGFRVSPSISLSLPTLISFYWSLNHIIVSTRGEL